MKKIQITLFGFLLPILCLSQVSEIKFNTQSIDFSLPPRTNISPMSIKLMDNYNLAGAPSAYGSILEIYGKSGHQTSQLYFGGSDNSKIRYREAFYNQNTWNSWITLLDSKNIVESDGVLKIKGTGNSSVFGNLGIGTTDPKAKLHVFGQENGAFNGLIIDNKKNYGSGTGISQTSRILLSLTENGVPNPLDRIFGIIESGTLNESSSTDGRLSFYVRDGGIVSEKVRINSNGNVGIGTLTPSAKLEVNGNTKINGNLIIGKDTEITTITGPANSGAIQIKSNSSLGGSVNRYLRLGWNDNSNVFAPAISINENLYVGIGTLNPDEKLTVNGTIHATEVKVTVTVPADYVFQKYYTGKSELKSDYVMPTLAEIENFTKKNHHLPNVPTAKEIQQNGLSLGEMSNKLLQKVEELTLYAIEQQKQIDHLKTENENYKSLSERLSAIEKELKK